jgi:hypothetical protein
LIMPAVRNSAIASRWNKVIVFMLTVQRIVRFAMRDRRATRTLDVPKGQHSLHYDRGSEDLALC